ncbi:MAG: hypothetical protein FJZ67_06335 [Bacteroidetes bacterium]|nr:hypothetical protein [Bacteroidota bacterium]
MNWIETHFLDIGLSWSSSKALPYFLSILLGLILVFLIKKIRFNKNWIKWAISLFVLLLPFSVYFAFYPIYEGDFSNLGVIPNSKIKFPTQKALTVVVLPDCPYCHQAIPLIDKIKSRNPKMTINYWVVTSDSLPPKTGILSKISSDYQVCQRLDVVEISQLVLGTFPCFILSENNKAIKVWNNNQFGVRALDEMEGFFTRSLYY